MFGGPPFPDTPERTEDRDPIGDYKLTNDMAAVAERLFASPGHIVELDLSCPNGHGKLQGRANRYTRSVSVWCPECTFRVSR
jgi:hypothetical protein